MKRSLLPLLALSSLLPMPGLLAQVEYVDPTIGGVGILLEPTRPTVHLPNSMVRVYPVRKDQLDDQIHSFPLTIVSHRLGELFALMPGERGAPAAWDQEVTTPYYYSTRFDNSLIRTEFTPAERCGYFRFTFPEGKACVQLANVYPGELAAQGDQAVSGEERFKEMKAYVYGEFSAPVTCTVTGGEKKRLVAQAVGGTLEFRYGVSFISVEQAKANLQQEIPAWSFEKIKAAARDRWNKVLGQVEVEGGSDAQRRVFYTSLYRCYERMINITEGGRYYSSFDHKVHADARPFYVDNWIWDTFRALEPLHLLLNPAMEADQLQSYVRMYEQSGWMPSFAVLWGDYACMNGNHAAGWFADAWFKGVRDFDVEKAYEGLRKNSLEATLLPWRNGPKCALDDFYSKHGYFPSLRPDEKETEPLVHDFENRQSVAVTLGTAYDDWCIAQLAKATKQDSDYGLFMKRAGFYKNVWNAKQGFMWPKDAAGKWIEPFDPKFGGGQGGRAYFDENNAYTYSWDVLHDFAGLFELMGGHKAAEEKLDNLFREGLGRSKYEYWAKFPDSTGLVGQFVMANEPSFSTPYLYNRVGAPWKTQKQIRNLLAAFFNDDIHGIPGDEDGGGMTAWVVFSMMGFYPVTPGVPVYDLGSPVFDRVAIRLHNGKTLQIFARNNSRDNKYIQSLKLNGKPLQQVWFRHADIVNGGTLELQMSNTPNKELGALPAAFPPSRMNLDPDNLQPGAAVVGVSDVGHPGN
ncbi:MAG: GH92 family glycosyl hydrolase [Verrucomicrobia bacterium]|nr:GH92 family glycosyl hydrolase [Verrucomicrobiota bacterium]